MSLKRPFIKHGCEWLCVTEAINTYSYNNAIEYYHTHVYVHVNVWVCIICVFCSFNLLRCPFVVVVLIHTKRLPAYARFKWSTIQTNFFFYLWAINFCAHSRSSARLIHHTLFLFSLILGVVCCYYWSIANFSCVSHSEWLRFGFVSLLLRETSDVDVQS